jgi:hypothetical protein
MLHENAIKKVKSQPGTNMAELVTKESSSSSFFFFCNSHRVPKNRKEKG